MIITALIWAIVIVGVPAGLGLIAYFRPWQLIPRRRAPRYAPRHAPRDMTPAEVEAWLAEVAPQDPAPEERPVQAPRPGDPPNRGGEVRAGATTPYPGGAPVPPEAAPEPAPPARAALPQPPSGAPPVAADSPGLGHPFRPVIMQFPGGEVGILGADGTWHIKPLAWQPGIRETGGLPALVRPGRARFEAWQDSAVNQ